MLSRMKSFPLPLVLFCHGKAVPKWKIFKKGGLTKTEKCCIIKIKLNNANKC